MTARPAIWLLGSLLALGCSFDGTGGGAGGPDGAPNRGDDGGVDQTDADTTDPDRDSDGVDNDVDNCPDVGNSGQENEDTDAHGNACDVCPHVVDDAQVDSDADGVGDACDPQPGEANTWLFFEGFDDDLDGDDWVGEGGWTVSSGEIRSMNNADRYFLRNTTFNHGDNALVGSSMRFANPAGNNGVSFRFGGPFGRGGPNDSNNGCWVLRSLNSGNEGHAFVRSNNGALTSMTFPTTTLGGLDYDEIEMTIADTDYECDYLPAGGGAVNLTQSTTSNENNGNVGVVSSYVDTHVRFLYAISLQP